MYLSVSDISKSFSHIIRLILNGEEIIVTKNKKPVAKLITLDHADNIKTKIKAGSAKGMIKIHENFDEPLNDFEDYMP